MTAQDHEPRDIAELRVRWHMIRDADQADEVVYTHAQVGRLLEAIPVTFEIQALREENAALRAMAAANAKQARAAHRRYAPLVAVARDILRDQEGEHWTLTPPYSALRDVLRDIEHER